MAQHRLQRIESPSPYFSLVVHLLGLASFAYSFNFLVQWDSPLSQSYGWHFQFLTIIGLAASALAFSLGALADITSNRALFQAKNAVAVIATPLEVVISILYWGIRFVDPSLLFPPELRIPMLPDIGFHLSPAVFLSLDLILLSPPWTITVYTTMLLSTSLAFLYWYWVELCFSKNGWYPYPLFGLLSTTQRILLFTFSAALVTASSSMLKWIYGFVNGYDIAREEAHKPLKKIQ
ncbi:hypothetical protein S7711_09246 [Stachybotrys chartarum IBT 7711]|uniref:FAR-17a/AIG1-like protein n=1 Tax=Stachybotrys chartarum (strain CBS 109288 / IBT 7711) TaxID=1280523 RepID=A0A084AJV7_STACB|nr:hypothetical protein S7711_09246 [Stachybotrys chartarum IBT 7711]KFA46535.1 hypothetical protein S40293_09177 [Stachybotrys chartarum IBT 40293]KFA71704.1 hypothetical protein S40288_08993 [Stachybotrys chartarum IBT 40288]